MPPASGLGKGKRTAQPERDAGMGRERWRDNLGEDKETGRGPGREICSPADALNRGEIEEASRDLKRGFPSQRKSSQRSGQTGQSELDPGEEGQEVGISVACTQEGQALPTPPTPRTWRPSVPGNLMLGGPGPFGGKAKLWGQSRCTRALSPRSRKDCPRQRGQGSSRTAGDRSGL